MARTPAAVPLALLLLFAVAAAAVDGGGSCDAQDADAATCNADADRAARRRRRLNDRATRAAMLAATNSAGTTYEAAAGGDDGAGGWSGFGDGTGGGGTSGDGTGGDGGGDGREVAYEVAGSDLPAINGVYVRTDEWEGQPLFTNQGLTAVLYFRPTLGPGTWVINNNHNLGGWTFLQSRPDVRRPAGEYDVASSAFRMTTTPVTVSEVSVPFGTKHAPRAISRTARADSVAPDDTVYVLHIAKTGGRSVRDAVGCFCGVSPRTGQADQCNRATESGRFVCAGHDTTCHDLPRGARYAVVFRNPFDRFLSAHNYQRNIRRNPNVAKHRQGQVLASLNDTLFMSRHQVPQWQYVSCEDNPPDFVGYTDTLAADWQRFRERYPAQCAEAGCKEELPHRHRQADMVQEGDAALQVQTLDDPASRRLVAYYYRHDFGLRDDWQRQERR